MYCMCINYYDMINVTNYFTSQRSFSKNPSGSFSIARPSSELKTGSLSTALWGSAKYAYGGTQDEKFEIEG